MSEGAPDSRRLIRLPRPLWFFLATVVLIVAAVGLRFGLPIYRQHAAIREIKRLGGTVEMAEGGPQWLRDRIGDEWMTPFDYVQVVYFRGPRVTDAGLVHLEGLENLQNLWLYNTQVTDAGLVHLKGLTSLQRLGLARTQVSDAGLAHLKGLTSLEGFWLWGTQVTYAGIADLGRALPNLKIHAN